VLKWRGIETGLFKAADLFIERHAVVGKTLPSSSSSSSRSNSSRKIVLRKLRIVTTAEERTLLGWDMSDVGAVSRRKGAITKENKRNKRAAEAMDLYERQKQDIPSICDQLKISQRTFYRYLNLHRSSDR